MDAAHRPVLQLPAVVAVMVVVIVVVVVVVMRDGVVVVVMRDGVAAVVRLDAAVAREIRILGIDPRCAVTRSLLVMVVSAVAAGG